MVKSIHNTDWILLILVSAVLLVGLLRHYFPYRFAAFFKVPISAAYFTEFAQEKDQPFWFGILLETVMLLSISLFIYLVLYFGNHQVAPNDYVIFIKIFLIAAFFDMAQHFFHSLTGLLFKMPKSLSMLMHVKDAYLRWASVVLLVLSMFIVFSPVSFSVLAVAGVVILSLLYFTGMFKGSKMLSTNSTLTSLHIFFYLCTLEILPVWVLIKMLA